MMRIVLLSAAAVIFFSAGGVRQSHAETAPWCAVLAGQGGGGGTNCGFYSNAQCREYISGIGGVCQPNLLYKGPAEGSPYYHPRKYRRHHRHWHRHY